MKPFNLEAALKGDKVVTRDGREVTQVTQFKGLDQYPLYGVIENNSAPGVGMWTISGQWFNDSQNERPGDLFMATKMKKISYRFYKDPDGLINVAIGIPGYLDHSCIAWVSDILEVEIEDND